MRSKRAVGMPTIEVDRNLPRTLMPVLRLLESRFMVDLVKMMCTGALEVMGIPYTGPDVRCAAVTMDKIATKQVMASHPDVVMAQDWICTQDTDDQTGLVFRC